jgi:predicted transcriptional regulator
MMVSKEELERVFQLLDERKASLRELAPKLNISKSSLHRLYAQRLQKEIEERRRTLVEIEQKISGL